nr:ParB/RepB/Spo0J family plasmid partition protein [Pantoea stewartii]
MRNAPQFDLSKVRASQPRDNDAQAAAPVVNELSKLVGGMKPGNTVSIPVCGREVAFTLRTIPAARVEKSTMVWNENERLQELLTEAALDDLIPSFVSGGQLIPAFAREVTGIIEVADGSRRRKTAIITGSDYRVLVGDLDDEQMAALSQTGNNYRQTSAYERGRRYRRLLEGKFEMNVTALASAEKVDRKIITRCLATANLPIEVIKLFANPSELSARAGHELSGIYANHTEEMMQVVDELLAQQGSGEPLKTEVIVEALKQAGQTPKETEKTKPTVRKFGEGVTAKYDGDNVNISLRGVAPELLRRIEVVLEAAGKQNGGAAVDKLISELEEKLRSK